MAERIQKTKKTTETKQDAAKVEPKASESAEEVKADIDELLDEIDGLLEENAEEFVKSYVQKGGE